MWFRIIVISERKLGGSLSLRQFHTDGFFTPIRLAHNKNYSGIKFFVGEDVMVKPITSGTIPVEGFYVEINLCKNGYLI